MTQQVRVERDLVFSGIANKTGNIKGFFNPESVFFIDHFTGAAVDTTNDYTFAAVNSGTFTVTAPHCGTLTTGGADDDDIDVASNVGFYGQYGCAIEVRCRNDDIDALGFNVGFSDATGEAADKIAATYSGTTLTTNCTDGALWVYDPDGTTDVLVAATAINGGDDQKTTTAYTLTQSSFITLRVELVDDGTQTNALFYYNSSGQEINPGTDLVAVHAAALTRTTALCAYVGVINREGAANTFDMDYIKYWGNIR